MTCLQRAFEDKYEDFKKSGQLNNTNLKGHYVVDNEFPIGEHDKQQYFRSIAFQVKLNGSALTLAYQGEKRPFTLIEGYSRNDESKKRSYAKPNSKSEKKTGDSVGKKKRKS